MVELGFSDSRTLMNILGACGGTNYHKFIMEKIIKNVYYLLLSRK